LPFSSHAFIICHLSSNQKAAKPRRLYHIEHWGSKFLLLTDIQTLHRNFLHLQKMGIDLYHLFVGWISAKSFIPSEGRYWLRAKYCITVSLWWAVA
jgi:hypothetical protein